MTAPPPETWFRKGFGLGAEARRDVDADYSGAIVDAMRASDNRITRGDVTVLLAREFGFCYGVERAVDYAYQTRRRFPGRRIHLLGEIIHNPHVNARMRSMGISIMTPLEGVVEGEARFDYTGLGEDDVVILPAFGVTMSDFQALRGVGCVVVDTTCGSVLNVWKRVESYARAGLTSLIHGKYRHEETRATASQVLKHEGGTYLVVRDMAEAVEICDYIAALGAGTADGERRSRLTERFRPAMSAAFDPDVHLRRIGVANQTTMLARESLAIGERIGQAIRDAFGDAWAAEGFRTFDTICSATQDRQDAVAELLQHPLDAMLVVGGFNSSNTISLAVICAERVPTYHIEKPESVDVKGRSLEFRPAGAHHRVERATAWLPAVGPALVGITAGASTPNNEIGEVVARVFASRGIHLAEEPGVAGA